MKMNALTLSLAIATVPANANVLANAWKQRGQASYYADKFEGRTTASGETFHQNEMTAAHKTLKFGTIVEVKHAGTGKKVKVKINDRGPFIRGRIIDLSKKAAKKLGILKQGVASVIICKKET
jgi:rare lipoprotein A